MEIKFKEHNKSLIEADLQEYKARPIELDDKGKPVFPSIELWGTVYTDKEAAGKALIESCKTAIKTNAYSFTNVGRYQGFELNIGYDPMKSMYLAQLVGNYYYQTELGTSESGITFEHQEKDGVIAVKINRCDSEKVHALLEKKEVFP